MIFIKHKEFSYSISNLVNFELDYYHFENRNSYNQKEEKKLHDLFDNLSFFTSSIRYITINILSPYDDSFPKRIISSIVNFITHQFTLEALSLNESLISGNLNDLEEIISSHAMTLKYLKIRGKLRNLVRILRVLRNCINLELLEFIDDDEVVTEDYMQDVDVWNYESGFGNGEEIGKREVLTPIIGDFEFNQLKIKNIYCIEDCVSEEYDFRYDQLQQQQHQLYDFNEDSQSPKVVNNYIVTFGLERTLIMTNINLRTLNLGKINSTIITTLGKYCYKLTHLSCELLFNDFYLFIKLLEVSRELKYLKLKLKLSSFISDNYIVAFAHSLSNSLVRLGLNIYVDNERMNDFIFYFLRVLLENLECDNLFELDFYNNQMIRNENLKLILQFALNRMGVGSSRKFKLFRYVREKFGVDFDHMLLQQGREIIQIEYEEISDFYYPFHEPFYYD